MQNPREIVVRSELRKYKRRVSFDNQKQSILYKLVMQVIKFELIYSIRSA